MKWRIADGERNRKNVPRSPNCPGFNWTVLLWSQKPSVLVEVNISSIQGCPADGVCLGAHFERCPKPSGGGGVTWHTGSHSTTHIWPVCFSISASPLNVIGVAIPCARLQHQSNLASLSFHLYVDGPNLSGAAYRFSQLKFWEVYVPGGKSCSREKLTLARLCGSLKKTGVREIPGTFHSRLPVYTNWGIG